MGGTTCTRRPWGGAARPVGQGLPGARAGRGRLGGSGARASVAPAVRGPTLGPSCNLRARRRECRDADQHPRGTPPIDGGECALPAAAGRAKGSGRGHAAAAAVAEHGALVPQMPGRQKPGGVCTSPQQQSSSARAAAPTPPQNPLQSCGQQSTRRRMGGHAPGATAQFSLWPSSACYALASPTTITKKLQRLGAWELVRGAQAEQQHSAGGGAEAGGSSRGMCSRGGQASRGGGSWNRQS